MNVNLIFLGVMIGIKLVLAELGDQESFLFFISSVGRQHHNWHSFRKQSLISNCIEN